jgi:predicted  nucleic acid-binding Zn-ribbon protein
MNAKQRKQAGLFKRKLEADLPHNLRMVQEKQKALDTGLAKLAQDRAQFEKAMEFDQQTIKSKVVELNQLEVHLKKKAMKEIDDLRQDLIGQFHQHEGVNIVREVLFDLELDLTPNEIAMHIRKKYNWLGEWA